MTKTTQVNLAYEQMWQKQIWQCIQIHIKCSIDSKTLNRFNSEKWKEYQNERFICAWFAKFSWWINKNFNFIWGWGWGKKSSELALQVMIQSFRCGRIAHDQWKHIFIYFPEFTPWSTKSCTKRNWPLATFMAKNHIKRLSQQLHSKQEKHPKQYWTTIWEFFEIAIKKSIILRNTVFNYKSKANTLEPPQYIGG